MNEAYRNPLAGHIAQLAERGARIERRLAEQTPLQRCMHDARERERLSTLSAALEAEWPADLEGLSAREQELAELEALLLVLHDTASHRNTLGAVQPWPPHEASKPWLIEELWLLEQRQVVRNILRGLPSASPLRRLGDASYGATFRHPVHRTHMALYWQGSLNEATTLYQFQLRVAVCAGLPAFRMVPEHMGHRIQRTLRLRREAELGSYAFDDSYFVECPADLATLLFDARRQKLWFEAAGLAPHLTVAEGVATLRCQPVYGPEPEVVQHALQTQIDLLWSLQDRLRELGAG